jgi:hypothetical protein
VVKTKSHRTWEYLALIPIESRGKLPEGGAWVIFRNLSNSEEFDEDQSEEIETQWKLSHHRIRVHAIRIHKSEEHAIMQ